jgi:hypothetical protein
MKLQQKGKSNFLNLLIFLYYFVYNFFFFFLSRAQLNIKTNRNNRKNVISCVTVGESDNEEQLQSKPLIYHQKQLQSLRSTPVIYQSSSKNSNIQV